ncbi:hypothetical protein BGZ93_003355 [Podila epicladia]|nr:hypothetical protein BGZ92_009609 [Podila epicladia]KAG0097133.1 hypothetical protein BGZ93_003355 [Podila epicladia]
MATLMLLCLATCALGRPTNSTLTPLDDPKGEVILDVGQHSQITTQNIALGTSLIIVGLVQVFFGFKFIRLTLFVTGFLAWAVSAMMIMVAIRWDVVYTTFMPNHYYMWVWIGSGLIGALLAFRYWDLGVIFTGAFGGFTLAMGIIAAANIRIENVGRYVILSVLILGGAAFATFYEKVFVIVATSFGGAYLLMYGVDEFVQVGYREMIVIFDFTGKTFTYHPNKYVYIMLASSVLLTGLGVGWEFWHHKTPLWMDRKAVFRIYGRPFGKRPKKLVGQRITHHVKSSGWYGYIFGALRRRTESEVLYGDDLDCVDCGQSVEHQSEPIPSPIPGSSSEDLEHGEAKPPKVAVPPLDTQPVKTAPLDDLEHKDGRGDESPIEILVPDLPASSSKSTEDVQQQLEPIGSAETTKDDTHSGYDQSSSPLPPPSPSPQSPDSVSFPTDDPGPSVSLSVPSSLPSGMHHPLFESHLGHRTMEMIHMVTDGSPGNTIPSYVSRDRPQQRFAYHNMFLDEGASSPMRSNLEIIQESTAAAIASTSSSTSTTNATPPSQSVLSQSPRVQPSLHPSSPSTPSPPSSLSTTPPHPPHPPDNP